MLHKVCDSGVHLIWGCVIQWDPNTLKYGKRSHACIKFLFMLSLFRRHTQVHLSVSSCSDLNPRLEQHCALNGNYSSLLNSWAVPWAVPTLTDVSNVASPVWALVVVLFIIGTLCLVSWNLALGIQAYILDENSRRHLYRLLGLFLCNLSYFWLPYFTNSSSANSFFLWSLSSNLSKTRLRLLERSLGSPTCAAIWNCPREAFRILGPAWLEFILWGIIDWHCQFSNI